MLLLFPSTAFAQAVGAGAFLRQDPSARAAALAGASGGLVDDSSAVLVNPAALTRVAKPEVGATRATLFEDTGYDVLTTAFPTKRWGHFGAAFFRESSGGFEGRAGPNDAPTAFTIEHSAFFLAWGYSPLLPWEERKEDAPRMLSVGLAAKSVRESVAAASGSGFGLDAAALLKPREDVSIGVRVENLMAPKPSLGSTSAPYARAVEISPAYTRRLGRDLRATFAARVAKVQDEGLSASGGVELQYGRLAALRVGAQEKGPSTGFGVGWGNTRVDYAALLHDLGVAHAISLTQRFGQTREEIEETIRRGISRLSRADGARLARAYVQKAERELEESRPSEARRSLEAAVLLDPGNEEISQKLHKADAMFEESLRRQTVERLASLAQQQGEQGNLLAARQYWRSVLDLDPEHGGARRELERIDGALSLEEKARAEGLRQAQKANDIALALAGAATYLARGQLRSAGIEAEKVRARYPDNPQVRDFIAQAKAQLSAFTAARLAEADKAAAAGDHAGALAALQAARREDPDNKEIAARAEAVRADVRGSLSAEARKQAEQLYYRAVEQYLKGSYPAAGALADEVLKLDPSSEAARALKEKVEAAQRYSR